MDEPSIEQKRYWTGILIRAQETLAESVGQPDAYFKADQEIRQARRELRRLEKGASDDHPHHCLHRRGRGHHLYVRARGPVMLCV